MSSGSTAQAIIKSVFARLFEGFSFLHVPILIAVIILSFMIVVFCRPALALLVLVVLSLLTGTSSETLAAAAYLGRWWFLLLAAITALARPSVGNTKIIGIYCLWVLINMMGIFYGPSLLGGAVPAAYFLLGLPAFFFSLSRPNHTPQTLIHFIRAIAVIGAFLAVAHLFSFVVGGAPVTRRWYSFYVQSQSMAMCTGGVTLAMIWALISGNAGKWMPFLFGGLIVNVLAIVASTQRTAIFGLGGAVVLLLLFYRVRGIVLLAIGAAAIVLLMGPFVYSQISPNYLTDRVLTIENTQRFPFWQVAVDEIQQAPLLGHGSGGAQSFTSLRFGMSFHSAYLSVAYDFGILGWMAFVTMILAGLVAAVRLVRSHTPELHAVGVFALAGISMTAVQGVVESSLSGTANQSATLFYVCLGLVAAGLEMRRSEVRQL